MIPPAPMLSLLLAPFFFGAACLGLFGRGGALAIPGLLFHSLSFKNRIAISSISALRFKSIIRALKKTGFFSVTFSDIADHCRAPAASARNSRPFLLTFDDGCRSVFMHALPVLEEERCKAMVFPVPGYCGMQSSWDVMPRFPHLTTSEIREISDLGHQIGSHGLSHVDCTLLSARDLTAELEDSKKMLEDITGKQVTALSFPFGSWNERVWERAREIGYTHGAIYRKHSRALPGLYPVYGVYRFDTEASVLARIHPAHPFSLSVACARIMSHFAKGAPMWKFEKKYDLLARTREHA